MDSPPPISTYPLGASYYFGYGPYFQSGVIQLLLKRSPGSTPGVGNSRTLKLDDLRIRIKFQ